MARPQKVQKSSKPLAKAAPASKKGKKKQVESSESEEEPESEPEPELASESEDEEESEQDVSEEEEEEQDEEDDEGSVDMDDFPQGGDRDDEDGSVSGSEGDEEEEEEGKQIMDNPMTVRERIDGALKTLGDFKNRADKSISRSDILESLATDLSEYYGYTEELAAFLLDLFSPSECVEYMDASDRPRPVVIRTNTLKVTRKELMEQLDKRGANVEAIEWSKVAIKIVESAVPIGATPEYLGGQYMLQSAASLNPVMALGPRPGEKVLDMSAAPGGKTTYIAQLMKNNGVIIANDLKPGRQKSTVANLHRMGVKNSIVCCYDGRKVPGIIKGFDRALLDAPCSGLGVISRDQTVKIQRTVKDIQRISHVQKELLCAAIDCVDHKSSAGYIVYSTCSISCEENEQVVQYALKKRHVKLVECGLEVGKPGMTRYKERRFHPSLSLTRRFYPHVHNMDGFYVAKFKKLDAGVKEVLDDSDDEDDKKNRKKDHKKQKKATAQQSDDDDEDEEEEASDDVDVSAMDAVGDGMEDLGPVKAVKTKPTKRVAAGKAAMAIAASDDNESDSADEDDEDFEAVEEEESEEEEADESMYVDEDASDDDEEDSGSESEDPSPVKTRATRGNKSSEAEADVKMSRALKEDPEVEKMVNEIRSAAVLRKDESSSDEEQDAADDVEEEESSDDEPMPAPRPAKRRLSIQEIRRQSGGKKGRK